MAPCLGLAAFELSQDHDLQQMYFDSFLKIANLEAADVVPAISKLEKVSETFHVDFILSISLDEAELPADLKEKVIISL